MSSFVWMKFLESAPERYDRGIQLLSRGRIADVYEQIAALAASPGKRVLDLGSGTGGVALACAASGAHVVAVDSNAGMLEIARAKPVPRVLGGDIEWLELGIAEVEDRFGEAAFDAIVSCLVFSELSPDEQDYALYIARSRLVSGGLLVLIVGGIFAALPWLTVTGTKRWLTFGAFTAIGFGAGVGILAALGSATSPHLWIAAATAVVAMGVLSVDLAGTTPWYGSYINTFHNEAHVDLAEERCTGTAVCVQVCPRDVLHMDGRRRKVEIKRADDCIQCGACIVQCPEDALRFRYDDDRVVEAATIRQTRMNMLGRRTVELPDSV